MKANKPKGTKTETPAKPNPERKIIAIAGPYTYAGTPCMHVPMGTYVSKSRHQEKVAKLKKLEDMWYEKYQKWKSEAIQYQDKFIALSEENSELKSSFSQLAEDREAHIKNYNQLFDSYRDLQTNYNEIDIKFCDTGQELCNTREELETEKKIAKFNFRWAMIATAAFILSIIYILMH